MKYTLGLLAMNIVVFAAYVQTEPGAMLLGVFDYVAGMPVSAGELFPNIITYMFGHLGIVHLLMNMFGLLLVGRRLEASTDWMIMPIYFGAGVVGAAAHMMYTDVPLLGASAAVSGLIGACVTCRVMAPASFAYYIIALNILPLFGVMSLFNIGDPGVSYISHAAGAAAGVGIGFGIARYRYKKNPLV